MSHLWTPRAGNILTYGQATFEDGSTGNSYFSGANGTLANSAAQAYSGTKSLAVTFADNGANKAMEVAQTNRPPVIPGQVYTVTAAVRSDQASGETFQVLFYSYTAAGASSLVVSSATTTVTNAGWTILSVTGVMPANAATATPSVMRVAGAANAVAYIDQVGLWMGAGGVWAPPGVPITGLGFKTDNTAGKASYIWDETVPGWRLIAYDSGNRTLAPENGWSAATAFTLRRNEAMCSLTVRGLTAASAASAIIIAALGTGFRPRTNAMWHVAETSTSTTPNRIVNVGATGAVSMDSGYATVTDSRFVLVWPTVDAPPTSLLGTQLDAPV